MRTVKIAHFIVVLAFAAIVCAPAVGMVCKLDPYQHLYENRELAKFPEIARTTGAIRSFPKDFDAFCNDNFGFRNALIRLNFLIKYRMLGVSPTNQVIAGKQGWLFFTGQNELEDYRGITRFDEEQLKKWAATMELKRQFLERKGIRYLFVLAPNKSTIYSEFLPGSQARVRQKTSSDEFIEYLRRHTRVEIVDLRETLAAAKGLTPLYYRTDSHWNSYGAFIAYQRVISPVASWFPAVQKLSADGFTITSEDRTGGDLASMIGGMEFTRDLQVEFTPLKPYRAKMYDFTEDAKPFSTSQDSPSLPRAIIFKDSYFEALVPFVSEAFQFTQYYKERWKADTPMEKMLKEYRPNIVIEEYVERLVKTDMADFSEDPPSYLKVISPQVDQKMTVKLLPRYRSFQVDPDTSTKNENGGVAYEARGNDPRIILPYNLSGRAHTIKIAINSSCDTYLQVYYQTSESPRYVEERSVKHRISQGTNNVLITIDDAKATGPLRLDPGAKAGKYVLTSLDVTE